MRLIHCQSLTLVEVGDPQQVKYAILSHTWEDGQEVNFDEFLKQEATHKRGWDKIRTTCRLAAIDGYEFAWCDTCCIDKTSSAELTEAINSMFLWYAASDICYVYLADHENSCFKDSLAASRWFARGWTLQELIAPTSIRFYDASWANIGTKTTLSKQLSAITGIDDNILSRSQNQDLESMLEQVPVARRMSWCANRETTRAEDMAYCLLGIFAVNLPMIYGEGERAFIRLQEEIVKNSNDMSLLAWRSLGSSSPNHPTSCCGVLARSPRDFQSSNTICLTNNIMFNPEFSITNKGVKIITDLSYAQKEDLHVLFINCHDATRPEVPLGIILKNQGAGVFARAISQEFAQGVMAAPNGTERKLFFLKKLLKTSVSQSLAEAHRCSFVLPKITGPQSDYWTTGTVKPEALWDSGQRMFITAGLRDFVGYYESLHNGRNRDINTHRKAVDQFFIVFGHGYGFEPWSRLLPFASNGDVLEAVKRGDWRMVANLATQRRNERLEVGPYETLSNKASTTCIVGAHLKPSLRGGEPVFVVNCTIKTVDVSELELFAGKLLREWLTWP